MANSGRPNSNQHSRPAYSGASRGLVVAIDFGTKYSGVAYTVLEPGEVPIVRSVSNYPSQDSGKTKVPSVLYYDHEGEVRARGAEVNDPHIASQAADEDWITVEWLKLLFRPEQHVDVPPTDLPPGRSDVQVLADFLQYLQHATHEYISINHAEDIWDSLESTIIYVLSHPNGWDNSEQPKLRQASEIAGLIPPDEVGQSRLRFISEGEASLHWCVDNGLAAEGFREGDNIIVADAGGGTIDVSSFHVTSIEPFKIRDVGPSECSMTGSIFVNMAFEEHIMSRLEGTAYDNPDVRETLAREFERGTKPLFRDARRPSYVPMGFRPPQPVVIPSLTIRSGQLVLPGEVMKSLFEPSCRGLVDAIDVQLASDCNNIVLFVGGFAASPWLYSELQTRLGGQNVAVRRADDNVAKAVAEGAIGFYLSHQNLPPLENGILTDKIIAPVVAEASVEEPEGSPQITRSDDNAIYASLVELKDQQAAMLERQEAIIQQQAAMLAAFNDQQHRVAAAEESLANAHKDILTGQRAVAGIRSELSTKKKAKEDMPRAAYTGPNGHSSDLASRVLALETTSRQTRDYVSSVQQFLSETRQHVSGLGNKVAAVQAKTDQVLEDLSTLKDSFVVREELSSIYDTLVMTGSQLESLEEKLSLVEASTREMSGNMGARGGLPPRRDPFDFPTRFLDDRLGPL